MEKSSIIAKLVSFFKQEFRESNVSPDIKEIKQGKFVEFISRRRVILEKLINHKTKIPFLQPLSSFTLGIIQIKVKSQVFSG